ncbi:MAG: hypothetical protein LBC65_05945, partial [Oscillospiraceae bacterium]|nr:hypothetical protein [Oscillospiraceae bacterium]
MNILKRMWTLTAATIALLVLTGCLPTEEEPLDAPVVRAADVARPTVAAASIADLINIEKIS